MPVKETRYVIVREDAKGRHEFPSFAEGIFATHAIAIKWAKGEDARFPTVARMYPFVRIAKVTITEEDGVDAAR